MANESESMREVILNAAKECICGDRDCQYGNPENSFARIAEYWSVYLGREIYPKDVGIMMALFKIARIDTGSFKADSYIDAVGYIACAAEIEEGCQ